MKKEANKRNGEGNVNGNFSIFGVISDHIINRIID